MLKHTSTMYCGCKRELQPPLQCTGSPPLTPVTKHHPCIFHRCIPDPAHHPTSCLNPINTSFALNPALHMLYPNTSAAPRTHYVYLIAMHTCMHLLSLATLLAAAFACCSCLACCLPTGWLACCCCCFAVGSCSLCLACHLQFGFEHLLAELLST